MKCFIIVTLIFLCACSESNRVYEDTDPEFLPYVEQFMLDSVRFGNNQRGREVPVNFGILKGELLATCKKYPYLDFGAKRYDREILVNKDKWLELDFYNRKSLIYHEMGHCLLNREHLTEFVTHNGDYIKSSVMFKQPINILDDSNRDDLYLYELFNNDILIWNE